METQFIKLNMIPTGINPCFHISQYDIGRSLGFMIYNGSEVVDLDSYTCTIEATRSDGVAITASVTTDDNIGTFETTATMTNKADKYKAQFVIVDGDSNRIASLPFDMDVVKAAMDENSESIEEDASLYQQYTEAVQGAIAEANADIQAEEEARITADTAINLHLSNISNIDVNKYNGDNYSEKLQNALIANASYGGRIYLPEGIIRLGDIIVPSGVSYEFIGYGMNNNRSSYGTIIKPLDANTDSIFIANSGGHDYCTFKNITFDGESTCNYGLGGSYWGGTYVERCSFLDFANVALNLKQGLNHVFGCYFKNPLGINMVLHSDSYVTNNEFSKSQTCAVIEASGNRIIGNLFNSGINNGLKLLPTPLTGQTAKACSNNAITNNYFGHNNGYNILISGDSDYDCFGNIISDNYFEMTHNDQTIDNYAEGAINAQYNRQLHIVNNVFKGFATTPHNPTISLSNIELSMICNNTFYSINSDAIVTYQLFDSIVDANSFYEITGKLLNLSKTARSSISNVINQSSTSGDGVINGTSYGGNRFFNINTGNKTANLGSGSSDANINIEQLKRTKVDNQLTYSVSVSDSKDSIIKSHDTITITFDFVIGTNYNSGNLFLIPYTYRPRVEMMGFDINTTTGHSAKMGINTSGYCYCVNGSLSSGDRVVGTLTYVR